MNMMLSKVRAPPEMACTTSPAPGLSSPASTRGRTSAIMPVV